MAQAEEPLAGLRLEGREVRVRFDRVAAVLKLRSQNIGRMSGWKTRPRGSFRYKTGTAQPLTDCKLLTRNDLLLAERVGFEPDQVLWNL